MLQIHILSIKEHGWDLDKTVDVKSFPLLTSISQKGTVSFNQPVHVRIHATIIADDTVIIKGAVSTLAHIPCSRCLESYDLTIDTEFTATATPDNPASIDDDAIEEKELKTDEMDAIVFSGNSIDLSDGVSQQIIMAIPIKPLCRDNCKGLCNGCGADLNKNHCQCDSQVANSPFSVLKGLSFPKKKE